MDTNALVTAVQAGIDANRKSSSKWTELYDWLSSEFGLDQELIRASLLADLANITNRIHKDNAWENPRLLALICVENVTPDMASNVVDDFVTTFHERLGALPRLRVVLIFDGATLVKIKMLTTGTPGLGSGQAPGGVTTP